MQYGRQDPPNPEARKSTDHPSTGKPVAHFSRAHVIPEKVSDGSTGELVAVTLITEFQVHLTSNVQKENSNRKETVKRLIQQFENHPNRDSLMEDLNKTEEFNPFSEKSKELITSMGNMEYFELCETSSKIQCPVCALYWEADIVFCTCGKCMQPAERNRQLKKVRFDVLSIPGCVIQKHPTHGARHGPSVRQTTYHKAHDMVRKARRHKSGGYKDILDRWNDDDNYRKSLSDIGWTEEQIIQYDASALEDHSYNAQQRTTTHNNAQQRTTHTTTTTTTRRLSQEFPCFLRHLSRWILAGSPC